MSSRDDISFVADLARQHDRGRYLASLFAAKDDRAHMQALIALSGELAAVDSRVTESITGDIRFQWWREVIGASSGRQPRDHPVVKRLAVAVAERDIPEAALLHFIDAHQSRFEAGGADQLGDLTGVCQDTYGRLAVLLLHVAGQAGNRPLADAARDLGTAWGLAVHIISAARVVGPGMAAVTEAELREAGLTRDQFRDNHVAPGTRALAVHAAEEATSLTRQARLSALEIPRRAVPVFLISPLLTGILKRMDKSGGQPLEVDYDKGQATRFAKLFFAGLTGRI